MIIKYLRQSITLIIVLASLHQSNNLLSQVAINGNPFIENFNRSDYAAEAQNWDSEIMGNGYVYIANDGGVLEYDGVNWKSYPLPNESIVRSLCITSNRIYVGGQDEFGYLAPSVNGTLIYHSIRDLIPEIFLPFQDVWQMQEHDGKIYMRSVNRIYVFDPERNSFKVIDPKTIINSLLEYKNEMHFVSSSNEIYPCAENAISLPMSEVLSGVSTLVETIQIEEKYILVTRKDGLFIYRNGKLEIPNDATNAFLKNKGTYMATKISDNKIAIGTTFGGLIIVDKDGNTLKKIDKEDGLTNNNVHTISSDKKGNLWIGTSNGINKISLASPLELFPLNAGDGGTFYDIHVHDDILYFGSNNALYRTDVSSELDLFEEMKYDIVAGSEGQVWGLDVVDGDLLMGHNNGAFIIQDGKARSFSNNIGAWKFMEALNEKEMYVGTYEGIDVYKKINNQWTFLKKLEGFIESSRIMISVKKNELWISHPYRGVYKIEHDNEYFVTNAKLYDERYGLPSILANNIFEIDGLPYVTAEKGIYYYDRIQDRFIKDEEMNRQIDSTKTVKRLFQENENKIWFLAEDEAGYISKDKGGSFTKTLYPNLADKFVSGFENMHLYSEKQALICGIDEVLCLNLKQDLDLSKPVSLITNVQLIANTDSILFGGISSSRDSISTVQSPEQIPKLTYRQNELFFTYCSPSHSEGITYSYALTDKSEQDASINWSHWSNQTNKEYNNLSSGKYTFMVRAKSQNNIMGDKAIYKFTINPPWYYSSLVLILYGLVAMSGLAALIFIPRKKYKKEKKILTTAKAESDAQLELIKTEKLKAEIAFKNSELASSTMHLVQKNETLNKIRHEIKNVSKKLKDAESRKEIRKILSLFSDDERLEDEWENFSRHFDEVHTDFLKRISSAYPQLTPKDKKLCAYLRMNLSTKEIAPLLNISVRGVEISRYRLRKKLELSSDVNLNEFMMAF